MDTENFDKLYHSDKPFSFGSKQTVLENINSTKEEISQNLSKNDIYTRYKQYKKPRKYSPIYVYKPRELFQADLVAFTNPEYIKANDGYKYLFTTIDVFTKYAWVYPLKSKDCETTKKCFEDILSKCGKQPEKLQTDRGSEFVCAKFKNFLKSKNIHHYVSYSDRKCPVVERFNLTIQQILYKILDKNESFRWIEFLDKAMKIYNSRKHTTIKLSPIEAEKGKNETSVRKVFLKRYKKVGLKPPKPKYKVGDTVRIWKFKRVFDRGYHENFTTQYFKIRKVLTNLPVVRYELEDVLGEKIIGSFFENELVPFEGMEFHRIKVIDTKGKGKNKKYLVHYLGWPDKFNEWVSEDRMKDILPEENSDDNEGVNQNVLESDQNSDDDLIEGDNQGNNNNDLENEENGNINEQVETSDEIENDNNEANPFYEPYHLNQDDNALENSDNNFYEPFLETNDDRSKNNVAGTLTRKRKQEELSSQPQRLKVNFTADNKKDDIRDINMATADNDKDDIRDINIAPKGKKKKTKKKNKKRGKK